MCTDDEYAQCKFDYEGNLEWACKHCETKRHEDLHPYTHKLLRIHLLRMGGFPMPADDLTLDEWMDLGRITQALDSRMGGCPLTGGKRRSKPAGEDAAD